MLNNELEKQHDIVKRLFLRGNNGTSEGNDAILIMALKRELDGALKSLAEKESELNNIKKCMKFTKFREID